MISASSPGGAKVVRIPAACRRTVVTFLKVAHHRELARLQRRPAIHHPLLPAEIRMRVRAAQSERDVRVQVAQRLVLARPQILVVCEVPWCGHVPARGAIALGCDPVKHAGLAI